MSLRSRTLTGALICLLASLVLAQSQAGVPAFSIHVGDKPVLTVTAAELATLPRHIAVMKEHDSTVSYEGVLLHDVLERAGAPLGTELRGKAPLPLMSWQPPKTDIRLCIH
jgi:hypothetical protein